MTETIQPPLILTSALLTQLHAYINKGYPYETCGLFIGKRSDKGWEVSEVTQAKNLNTDRAEDRFQLDPIDFMTADNRARESGLEIIGIWHSHPDHPAAPSPTDLAAAWEGYSYLIAKVTKEGVEAMTSWRLVGANFEEEEVIIL